MAHYGFAVPPVRFPVPTRGAALPAQEVPRIWNKKGAGVL